MRISVILVKINSFWSMIAKQGSGSLANKFIFCRKALVRNGMGLPLMFMSGFEFGVQILGVCYTEFGKYCETLKKGSGNLCSEQETFQNGPVYN